MRLWGVMALCGQWTSGGVLRAREWPRVLHSAEELLLVRSAKEAETPPWASKGVARDNTAMEDRDGERVRPGALRRLGTEEQPESQGNMVLGGVPMDWNCGKGGAGAVCPGPVPHRYQMMTEAWDIICPPPVPRPRGRWEIAQRLPFLSCSMPPENGLTGGSPLEGPIGGTQRPDQGTCTIDWRVHIEGKDCMGPRAGINASWPQ